MRKVDYSKLTGRRFGMLEILNVFRANQHALCLCKCSCGNEKEIRLSSLMAGFTRSCGCFRRNRIAAMSFKHGHAPRSKPSTEWVCWHMMRQRCLNPKIRCWKDYGGRGITVCKEWESSFEAFLSDMGPKPFEGAQIERTDNDLGYFPKNCRWATRSEQARNRRPRARLDDGTFAPKELAA